MLSLVANISCRLIKASFFFFVVAVLKDVLKMNDEAFKDKI